MKKNIGEIKPKAFENRKSLTSYVIPDGVIGERAFARCINLTSVVIPDSVTSIGKDAFSGCSGLKSITIPDSVTSIGEYAFSGCSSLQEIIVAEGNPVYHSAGNCIIETESKTLIAGCKSSVIPNDGSVTSIGEYAFLRCSGLTSITIPDSVTCIGWGVFSGCSGLTSITIPFVGEKMDGTGETSFDHIFGGIGVPDSLKEVFITGGKNIGEHAFSCCRLLKNITIPDSVTSIGEYAFSGCCDLTSVTIPDSVGSIGDWAFSWCIRLTSVTIPDSVTSIGHYTFYSCDSLTTITYHGTMAQWRAIKKGDGWDKGTPDYKVHCADGVLDKDDD